MTLLLQLSDITCCLRALGLEFERWLNGCGPPLYEPDLSAGGGLTRPVQDLCDLWRSSNCPDIQAITTFDLSTWSTFQIVLFLDRMLDHSPLAHGTHRYCYQYWWYC